MQSVNRQYLQDIITRAVAPTIGVRRISQRAPYYLFQPHPTKEEVLDFIQSIPYFDEKLKQFLTGGTESDVTIVSQTWETTFLIKCTSWANSNDWLHKDVIFSIGFYPQYLTSPKDALTLPY